MGIKLRFEFEGKMWTAEPAPYVRAAGVQLKVTATDADGNAVVKPDAKKGVQCNEATEVVQGPTPEATEVVQEPTPDQDTGTTTKAAVASLKAQWEEAAAKVTAAQAEQSNLETKIASALLAIPRKKAEPHTPVLLGGTLYRAQRARKTGEAPSLVQVPSVGAAL